MRLPLSGTARNARVHTMLPYRYCSSSKRTMILRYCSSSKRTMILPHSSCHATGFVAGFGSISIHFRRTHSIIFLTSACVCASWHPGLVRGALPADLLAASEVSELVLRNPASGTVTFDATHHFEAAPEVHADTGVQSSRADAFFERYEKLKIHGPFRRLQPHLHALLSSPNAWALHHPDALESAPHPVRSQPAMDVTFLFAPPRPLVHAGPSAARTFHMHNDEFPSEPRSSSSQASISSQSGDKRRSEDSVYPQFPGSDASRSAYDFLLRGPKRHMLSELYAQSREPQSEKEEPKALLSAHADGHINGGDSHKSNNRAIHSYTWNTLYGIHGEPISSQLQSSAYMHEQTRGSPELTDDSYPSRQHNPTSFSQNGGFHSNESSGVEITSEPGEGRTRAVLPHPSGFATETLKGQNIGQRSAVASPQSIESPTNSSFEHGAPYNMLGIPTEAATGILPALFEPLQPVLGPLLRLQILLEGLFRRQNASVDVSANKHVVSVVPVAGAYSSATPDRPSNLTASQRVSPSADPQPLTTYIPIAGVLPFLSELLTATSLSHTLLGWLGPNGQKSPQRAAAHPSISRASGNHDTTGEILPHSTSAAAGVKIGIKPAERAELAHAEPYESVWDYKVENPAAVLREPWPRHVSEATPFSDSSTTHTNNDSVTPASPFGPALPRPNRGGNMTAPYLHPRPSHSIPLHVLPTDHLRHIGDLDRDMADFLDSVIQRIWRTASGPSSFMRVPPPLYSHRTPEGTNEEDALALEEEEQVLQQEGQQQEKRLFTLQSEEEENSWRESAEEEDESSRREPIMSRWIARSARYGCRPSSSPGVTGESSAWESLLCATLLALQDMGQITENRLQVPEEEVSGVAQDGSAVGTRNTGSKYHKESSQSGFFDSVGVRLANATDDDVADSGILPSGDQHKTALRKQASFITPSIGNSPIDEYYTVESNDVTGSDPVAVCADVGHSRGGGSKGFQVNCSVGCQLETGEFEADSPVVLQCRTAVQGNELTGAPSHELVTGPRKKPLPLSLQRVEYTDANIVRPPRFPLFNNNETTLHVRGSVSLGPQRPTPYGKDSTKLLSSLPYGEYPCPSATVSTYSSKELSSHNSVTYEERGSGKTSVETGSNLGCPSEMSLLTQGTSDEIMQKQDPTDRECERTVESAGDVGMPFDVQTAGAGSVGEGSYLNFTEDTDTGTLVSQKALDVEMMPGDLREPPREESLQLFYAQQRARLRRSGTNMLEQQGKEQLAQKHSPTLLGELLSARSVKSREQAQGDRAAGVLLHQDPVSAAPPLSRVEESGRIAPHTGTLEADERQIPRSNLSTEGSATLSWFGETVGRDERRQRTAEYTFSGESPPLHYRTAVHYASPAHTYHGDTVSGTTQPNFVDDPLSGDTTVELERPWHWEDAEDDFFLAFNGFPTPYDYYFPLDATEVEGPHPLDSNKRASIPLASGADGTAGSSQNGRDGSNSSLEFPPLSTIRTQDASETNAGTTDKFPSRDVFPRGAVDFPASELFAPVGDEHGLALGEASPPPHTDDLSFVPAPESEETLHDGGVPLLSKLSSFFRSFPLVEWLRLDPTRVGPFDWKQVFGDLIPVARRIKRAKELAHGVILNEYCNRTASEFPRENASAALTGFALDLGVIPLPTLIQSDFEKCVDYYRTRTKEYIEEYRIQCQDVWGDPRTPDSVRVSTVTIDDVVGCLVQKYDVGRKWFNELFYQPWYRLINQTSYLLQAVETAVTEFQYDAWFFPAAYSAANFGLWRVCTNAEDCFIGEKCVEALPSVYNFTLSFCHHTPESMNLDPVTGVPLEAKFS